MFRGLTWEACRASTTATADTDNENQPTTKKETGKKDERQWMIVVSWAYVGGLSGLDHCHRRYRQRQSTNNKKETEKRRTTVDDCCFVGLRGRPVGPRPLPPPIPTTTINQHDKRKQKKDEQQWMIVVSWAYVGGLLGLDHCHRQYQQRESTNTTKKKEKRRTTVDDCCFVGLRGRPVGPRPLPPPIPYNQPTTETQRQWTRPVGPRTRNNKQQQQNGARQATTMIALHHVYQCHNKTTTTTTTLTTTTTTLTTTTTKNNCVNNCCRHVVAVDAAVVGLSGVLFA